MARHFPLSMPNAATMPPQVSLRELREATHRLTEILMAEADLLAAMKVGEVVQFQQEKIQLTRTLEMAQSQLAAHSPLMMNASDDEREDLLLLTDDLAYAVEYNHRQASAARAVNSRVMQAIMDVVSEGQRPASYDSSGLARGYQKLTLSLNLNQQA